MCAYSRVDICGEVFEAQSGTVDSYRWLIQVTHAVLWTAFIGIDLHRPQDDGYSKTGKNSDHLDGRSPLPGCINVQSFQRQLLGCLGSRNKVVRDGRCVVRIPARTVDYFFSKTSSPSLGSTQSSPQWLPGVLRG